MNNQAPNHLANANAIKHAQLVIMILFFKKKLLFPIIGYTYQNNHTIVKRVPNLMTQTNQK